MTALRIPLQFTVERWSDGQYCATANGLPFVVSAVQESDLLPRTLRAMEALAIAVNQMAPDDRAEYITSLGVEHQLERPLSDVAFEVHLVQPGIARPQSA